MGYQLSQTVLSYTWLIKYVISYFRRVQAVERFFFNSFFTLNLSVPHEMHEIMARSLENRNTDSITQFTCMRNPAQNYVRDELDTALAYAALDWHEIMDDGSESLLFLLPLTYMHRNMQSASQEINLHLIHLWQT